MSKFSIDPYLSTKIINNLIEKYYKEKEFNIGEYTVKPLMIVTTDNTYVYFPLIMKEYFDFSRVYSVVINVIGFNEDKQTQIEITRNGEVYYSPRINRNEEEIKNFVLSLGMEDYQNNYIINELHNNLNKLYNKYGTWNTMLIIKRVLSSMNGFSVKYENEIILEIIKRIGKVTDIIPVLTLIDTKINNKKVVLEPIVNLVDSIMDYIISVDNRFTLEWKKFDSFEGDLTTAIINLTRDVVNVNSMDEKLDNIKKDIDHIKVLSGVTDEDIWEEFKIKTVEKLICQGNLEDFINRIKKFTS